MDIKQHSTREEDAAIKEVLSKDWFYSFELPGGSRTQSYLGKEIEHLHFTRVDLMNQALEPIFGDRWDKTKVIDLACHQGYFGNLLAAKGAEVVGVDARQENVDASNLIAKGYGHPRFKTYQNDIHAVSKEKYGTFDVVLMFGLLYHLENPVGALRIAHALTKDICLIETQVAPNLSGDLEWGHEEFTMPMKGSFAVIDETHITDVREMSTIGICLAPSIEALIWIMKAIGFKSVEIIQPLEDAYEQHVNKKRVMVAGRV